MSARDEESHARSRNAGKHETVGPGIAVIKGRLPLEVNPNMDSRGQGASATGANYAGGGFARSAAAAFSDAWAKASFNCGEAFHWAY